MLLKVPGRSSLELDALARYVDGERHLIALVVLRDRLPLSRRAGWREKKNLTSQYQSIQ